MDFLELIGDHPEIMVPLVGVIGVAALVIWLSGPLGSFAVALPLTIGLVVLAVVLSALAWRRRRKPDSN
jgi:membrane protein implicated in regulation of membrane protease activity